MTGVAPARLCSRCTTRTNDCCEQLHSSSHTALMSRSCSRRQRSSMATSRFSRRRSVCTTFTPPDQRVRPPPRSHNRNERNCSELRCTVCVWVCVCGARRQHRCEQACIGCKRFTTPTAGIEPICVGAGHSSSHGCYRSSVITAWPAGILSNVTTSEPNTWKTAVFCCSGHI